MLTLMFRKLHTMLFRESATQIQTTAWTAIPWLFLICNGKHHSIAGDLGAFPNLYLVDADHRDALAAVGVADDETFVVAADRNAIGVDDKFHRVMIISGW